VFVSAALPLMKRERRVSHRFGSTDL